MSQNYHHFVAVVQLLSCVQLFAAPWLQHARLPCPSPSSRVCSNSCPWCRWCHPTISSSVALFSCPQSSPASRSFPSSLLFASCGQKEQYIFKNWWKPHCSFSSHSKLLLLSTQQAIIEKQVAGAGITTLFRKSANRKYGELYPQNHLIRVRTQSPFI